MYRSVRMLAIAICIICAVLSLVAGIGTLYVVAENRMIPGSTAWDTARLIWHGIVVPGHLRTDDDLWCLACVEASCVIGLVVSCVLGVIFIRTRRP